MYKEVTIEELAHMIWNAEDINDIDIEFSTIAERLDNGEIYDIYDWYFIRGITIHDGGYIIIDYNGGDNPRIIDLFTETFSSEDVIEFIKAYFEYNGIKNVVYMEVK